MSTKISQLTSATDITASDLMQIVDVEDGVMAPSGTNKKITAQLLADDLAGIVSAGSIATSKLASGALPSGVTVSSTNIVNGTIVDADINSNAAIASAKLAPIVATGSTTARSLVDRFADSFNIKDFGAIGDGVANDTAALQAAINAIPSIGGSIYIPAGRYKITSTITIYNKTVSIYGDGSGQSTAATDGSIIVFHSLGTSNGFVFDNVDGAYMRDIAIGADASTRPTGGYLVVYQGTSAGFYHADWQNVSVAGGYNGTWLKNGFNFKAYNSIWKEFNGNQSILLNGSSDQNDVQASEFTNCTIAAGTETTDLVVADGYAASTKFTCCALLFGRHGIWLRDTYGSANTPGFNYFIGGGMENLAGDCFRAEAGNHIMISGAYFSADGGRSRGFYTSTGFGGEITISGCYFRGAARGGIWLEDGNTVITGNTIVNNNRASPLSYSISNCSNNGSGLIRVTTSSTHDFETNDMVLIESVTGTIEANGAWIITVINSTTFDLSINADSNTGEASAFSNAYISGGNAELGSASIRILPTASWVNITGNNLGGASGGVRNTDYAIHNAGSNVVAFANNAQSVTRGVFQSISNTRLSYGSRNVGVTSTSGIPDTYATDGVLSMSVTGAVSSGTYYFDNQKFISGQKIRITRITRKLSSGVGNTVSARVKVDGANVSITSQDGSTLTDTLLSSPIVIDGLSSAKSLTIELVTTESPTDFVFDAQYQIIG
jgi:hypothetical protein